MIAGVFPATTMPDEAWWRVLWPDPVSILGEMRVRLGMVVIDLCCGDGLFTIGIAGIARRVYAVDIDPATLDRARRRVKAAGATNCDFIAADAMAGADILPEPVDYVFLANTLHGVPDQPKLTRAVAATRFGIVNWHSHTHEEAGNVENVGFTASAS